ncbi:hypothetical protein [Roseospira goensis]|uniref:Uncharacterized protein n=1 Tax=Roseospira goensis TaxID=391922 RepID=A0A7W6S1H6_9PROT|nr:hypothetical protein [Roseospira goensis]MBB4287168.1 hypothetical protein [Roseospira goensis]
MLAIRLSFYAVAVLFAVLGVQQGWHAVAALGADPGADPGDGGGIIAALSAVACFVAAAGTVWVTLKLE